jgi:hypothetical protein
LALVITACGSLQAASWHPALRKALEITTPAAVIGLVIGFLLAWIRRIPRFLAHIIGLLAGIVLVVQLSGTLREVLLPTTGQSIPFLDPALQGWGDLATELLIRIIILWRTFIRGATGEDIVLFVVLLTWASWLMGFLSAWFAIRSRWPIVAVGVPGAVLLLNTFYAPRVPVGYFGFYLFLTLVFFVYYFWKQREFEWRKEKVRYPPEMSRGVLWAGIVLSIVLVLGTSFLPTTAGGSEVSNFWERFIQPWREVRTTWERLFSNVSGDYEPKIRLDEFSPRFGLAGARNAPEGVAFVVRSNRGEYLRALTFDQYTGHGWNSPSELGPVWPMDESRLPISQNGRIVVYQEITPYLQGGNIVFSYAEPVSTSLPAIVELSAELYGPDKMADIVAVRTRSSLAEEQPYTVVSYVSVIDKTSLRRSGQSYPTLVTDRYLQLPAELPQRVQQLADLIVAQELMETIPATATGEITLQPTRLGAASVVVQVEGDQIVAVSPSGSLVQAGLVTPYDAAEAIEEYLRTEYPYSDDIPAPPSNVDAVDHFLFDSKTGYCDYFASAMTVLMRTQGVPARLARGYTSGYYDEDLSAYVVPARVAHSWVEVYFPNYGWQRFEPTAAAYTVRPRRAEAPGPRPTPIRDQPIPDDELDDLRPPRDLDSDPLQPSDISNDTSQSRQFPWAALGIPGGLVALGALALGVLALRANQGLRGLGPAAASYERMYRWADTIRLIPPGEKTPYEVAGHLGEMLAERRSQIIGIATAYVRERFGHRQLTKADVDGVRQSWQELRWMLWSFPGQQAWTRIQQLWGDLRERVEHLFRERPAYY